MTEAADINRFVVWLSAATIQATTEQYDAWADAARSLASGMVGEDVVLAAHGMLDESSRGVLSDAIIESDPTFAPRDRDEFLARFACAVVINRLELADEDQLSTAALVESARFCELVPRIEEVRSLAESVIDNQSRAVRARGAYKRSARRRSPLPDGSDTAAAVAHVNAVAKQADDAILAMEQRLQLVDEEVNTLWWARTEVSRSTGTRWDSMDPVTRAITSALELSDQVRFFPPTAMQLSIMEEVAGSPDSTLTLADAGSALSASKLARDTRARLLPLSTAASIWAEFGDELKTADALLRKAGHDPKKKVRLSDVGDQILREVFLTVNP